jgi:hypothetical protein
MQKKHGEKVKYSVFTMNIRDTVHKYFENKAKIEDILQYFGYQKSSLCFNLLPTFGLLVEDIPNDDELISDENDAALLIEQVLGCLSEVRPIKYVNEFFLNDFLRNSLPLRDEAKVLEELDKLGFYDREITQTNEDIYSYGEFYGTREDRLRQVYEEHPETKMIMESKSVQTKAALPPIVSKELKAKYICYFQMHETMVFDVVDSLTDCKNLADLTFCVRVFHATFLCAQIEKKLQQMKDKTLVSVVQLILDHVRIYGCEVTTQSWK